MRFKYLTTLIYSPRGASENAKKSRLLLGACKSGREAFSETLVRTIVEDKLQDYFTEAVLIPIPRSTLTLQDSFLPAKVIADVFLRNGIGNSVSVCLKRINAIPKSSSQFSAETRNSVQTHLDSLGVEPVLIPEKKIVIIDDVLTLGRTAMAAAIKLQEAFPDKEIVIYSPFRTRSFEDNNILRDTRQDYMELNTSNGKVKLPD